MESSNKTQEAKSDLDSNDSLNLSKTLVPTSPSSSDASRSSVDSTRPESSSPRLRYTPSSSTFRFSKSRCAICLCEIRKEDGKAIFTAECSHSFHFDCITSNVKHGNRICPLCRTQWKQVPLFDVNSLVPTIPAQRGFEDDEFLPHGETQSQNDDQHRSDRQALEVKLFPEVSALAKPVTRNDFAVLVHLKAEGLSDADRRTRAPLDLITVLDVSGSMEGVKLDLMKQAMGFVIQNLGETDRLSVIAFSSTARRLFSLRLMSETGKQAAMQAVNSLVAGGGTNIAEGLKIGARVIEDRRWKNPVSGMMLLSDGQDNYTLSHNGVRLRSDFESLLPSSCRIPIHTFGFGSDHDAELMHTISAVSSGTFSFIETETVIQDAFAQCIGGLLSVVILEQVVEIECVYEHGLKISSIKAGSYRSRVASDARTATIDVGDMYAEEERDFLVILEIPCCENQAAEAESMSLLKVRCVYKDPVTKETVRLESGELSIQRPMELTGEEVVSIEVDRQLSRFLVSQAMSEARVLADGGDLNAAVEILRNRERELSETASALSSDRLCQSLASELNALQERMTSRRMYRTSGRAYAFSSMSSHSAQRATARGDSTQGFSPVQAYQTTPMARMVTRSQQLGLGSPKPSPARGS
ncbi:E3 ubiquitin-protein ligase WAV3 [Cardamine amara subsp. amara]|uniref:E3 ubiquitin-protein ligase WAV3 n=1 Tax=Cardamine amara subsp. amara TaxID=228776 RepID=A0ABD1A535_CARAN